MDLFPAGPTSHTGIAFLFGRPTPSHIPASSIPRQGQLQEALRFLLQCIGKILDEGEKMGIQREEACHNLLFATCFNSYGGMKILFPSLLKFIGQACLKLHKQLAEEIRMVIQSNGGTVTMSGMEQMELMKSVVYETLRINPPVPLQYGKAKKDLV
ncbi:hypothetical protein NE237_014442 [Protea cynaroides]|uniref:Uncharacterized protein n=1 Tax=Protea cynaroides TaxID=273540 RepID=A0A9Q0KCC2_9MAGN|nr:hypothetical protein NE237_014442 [Protea cynaroides]